MTNSPLGAVVPSLSVSIIALVAALGSSNVAAIAMDGSDGGTQSSFNTSANWEDDAAPVPGQTYETNGFQLRTPNDSDDHTFAGDQLSANSTLNFRGTGNITVNSVGGSGGLVLSGATIVPGITDRRAVLSGLITLSGSNVLQAADTSRGITINSRITGSGGATLQSSAGDGGEVLFTNASNDYSGTTTLDTLSANGVILRAGAEGVFSANSIIAVEEGSRVVLGGFDNSVGGLTATDAGIVENASGTAAELIIQGGGGSSFSGSLQDGAGGGLLSLHKSGTGTQTFSGANTYTGGTTIEQGTLVAANGGALGVAAVDIGVDSLGAGTQTGMLGLDAVINTTTTLGNDLNLEGRNNDTAHLNATGGGTSSVTGAITLNETTGDNPAQFNFSAETGSILSLDGTITDDSAAGSTVRFGGGGNVELNTALNVEPTGIDTVEKVGAGTLTVGAQVTGIDQLNVDAGAVVLADQTLGISSAASSASIDVASGAAVQQDGVQSIIRTQTPGQTNQQTGGVNNAGTIDLNDQDASINWLTGSGVVDNTVGESTLSLGNSDGVNDQSFTGTLQDSGGTLNVVKDRASTQSVGSIDVVGTLGVTGGSLTVTGTTDSGDVTVASGATLNTTSTASTGSITSSGTLTATGAVDTVGDVAINGGTATFSGGLNTTTGDPDGAFTQDGGTSTIAGLTTGTADATINDGTANISSFSGGNLNVNNNGATYLDGTGNFGAANVDGGELIVLSSGALVGTGGTKINGGEVRLDGTNGALSINERFQLVGQSGVIADEQLNNIAGANTIAGAAAGVELVDGSGSAQNYSISTEGGTLTIAGTGIDANLASGTRSVSIGGVAGTNTIDADSGPGLSLGGGASYSLIKEGASEWSISGTEIAKAASIETKSGILKLTDATTITGTATAIMVAAGATLDVSLANGGDGLTLSSGQTISGNGTVNGDIIAGSGAVIGAGSSIGTLYFGADLTIADTAKLFVELSGSETDLIDVNQTLTLATGSIVEFDVLSTLTANVYRFARYGSLSGAFGNEINVPDLYSISYGYEGEDVIALVRETSIVPQPASLALLALGLFGMAASRRRAR